MKKRLQVVRQEERTPLFLLAQVLQRSTPTLLPGSKQRQAASSVHVALGYTVALEPVGVRNYSF